MMEMTKREYAEMVAREIEGAEVHEVPKANGIIMTGIMIKKEDSNCAPNVYVDSMYEREMPVEDAAEEVKRISDNNQINVDINQITDWSFAKERLSARLYNEATQAEVFMSAKEYGFDDLIIVPVVNVEITENGIASVKVTKKIFEAWGVSEKEVFYHAMENAKGDVEIKSMMRFTAELAPGMMAIFGEASIPEIDHDGQNVVTNADKMFGAIAVIFAHEKLKEIYPNGYIVLPSSVHEVIVSPYDEDEWFSNIVGEVNNECVNPTEVLGHKAYLFKGKGVA